MSKISLYVDLTTADLSWRLTQYTLTPIATTLACCGQGWAGRSLVPRRLPQPTTNITLKRQMIPPQVKIKSQSFKNKNLFYINGLDQLSLPEIMLTWQEFCSI